MAYVLTYNTLETALLSYLEREDPRLVAQIPLFIANGQRRLATKLKLLGTKQSEQGTLIVGMPFLDKDVRWLVNESFSILTGPNLDKKKQLYHRTVEYCQEYWPTSSDEDEPVYYTSIYNQLKYFVVPTPDRPYPYESIYWATPQLLDTTYEQNFMTTGIPRLLLYSCLVETAPYLHDDDRVPMWEQIFNEEANSQNVQEVQRLVGVTQPHVAAVGGQASGS